MSSQSQTTASTHTAKECLQALQRVTKRRGDVPTRNEYVAERDPDDPPVEALIHYFDDWQNVRHGLKLISTPSPTEQFVDVICSVADELGRTPTRHEYDEFRPDDAPPAREVESHFGGWTAAREQADLPPPAPEPEFSDEDCYEALRRVANELGHSPTMTEYDEHKPDDAPTAQTIASRANGWRNAHEEAGATLLFYGHHSPPRTDLEDPPAP